MFGRETPVELDFNQIQKLDWSTIKTNLLLSGRI
jgi:hypothetical protein